METRTHFKVPNVIFRPILLIHFERLKSDTPTKWLAPVLLLLLLLLFVVVVIVIIVIVSFLKRAQIFAADVWYRFNGKGYGEFKDINTITMFADYQYAVQDV